MRAYLNVLLALMLLVLFANPTQAATPLLTARFSANVIDGSFNYCAGSPCDFVPQNLAGQILTIEMTLAKGAYPVDPAKLAEAKALGPLPFTEDDANLSIYVSVLPPVWLSTNEEKLAFNLV